MAFCSNCGSEIYAGNKFCSKCGASVSGSPAPQTSGLSQQEKNALGMRLSELANNVDSLQGIMGQIEKVKAQFQIPEPRKPRTATRWWAMKGFVFGGIGAFVAAFYILLFLLSLRSEYDDVGTLIGGIVVIALICGVGITLIVIGVKTSESRMNRYNTNSINKYNAEVQRRNGIIQNLNNQYSELEKANLDTDNIINSAETTWNYIRELLKTKNLQSNPVYDKNGKPIINKNGLPKEATNLPKSKDHLIFLRGTGGDSSDKKIIHGVKIYRHDYWIKGSYIVEQLNYIDYL